MKTVKLKRAAILVSGAIIFILLCVITSFPSTTENSRLVRAIRPERHFQIVPNRIAVAQNPVAQKPTRPEKKDVQKADKEQFQGTAEAEQNEQRKEKVVEMMLHAWNGYRNYSWGANELRPISKAPHTQAIFGGASMPATIVDAADTLWIMDLKEEYEEARDYIKQNFDMGQATGTLSVFETTIRFLGGLLSLYALTGEAFYVEKARSVGEALLPAFNTPSGIPKSNINMKTKYASNYGWADSGSSILSEVGTLHLEFTYLSRVAKAPIFAKKVKRVRDILDRQDKPNGLYANFINPDTGKFTKYHHVSLGALGDSFYEYLIKSWLQSGKTDKQARRMYWEASAAIQRNMVFTSKTGLTYVAELRNGLPDHKMGHLACFSVGMFALQAVNEKEPEKRATTMKLAEELGKTCHESYVRTTTRIGPEMFYFSGSDEATSRNSENSYILRPEVIEGFFYLWRLTKNSMYRDWVWDAVQAIDKYCRVEAGFSGLLNVYDPKQGRDNVQQSFFLAETLKYAYLTFSDKIPLDRWVFNTEAHPLPVME
ncbi:alpha-1 2-Mannosidase [Trichostrongylus colubriformis]|uniref:alpha-1,2-Mannosidase n=1 Tax=Trichostrongylus colubriformis TaxID=6319 RepID=A0AAN8FTZ0_TRICO